MNTKARIQGMLDQFTRSSVQNIVYMAKASKTLGDLTGKGVEYLLNDKGEVIAVFYDGDMQARKFGNTEVTLITAS